MIPKKKALEIIDKFYKILDMRRVIGLKEHEVFRIELLKLMPIEWVKFFKNEIMKEVAFENNLKLMIMFRRTPEEIYKFVEGVINNKLKQIFGSLEKKGRFVMSRKVGNKKYYEFRISKSRYDRIKKRLNGRI